MVARPAGVPYPLKAFWGADFLVFGNGVALCVVVVMGPVIERCRLGFLGGNPRAVGSGEEDAVGDEDAEGFVTRNVSQIFGDDEVHEVVDVGERFSVEAVDGNGSVQAVGLQG